MPRRETLNNANTAKIMAETFGRYNIFATLSLSLSLSLSGAHLIYIKETITNLFLRAGRPRQGQCKPSAEPSSLGLCRGAACLARKGNIRLFLHLCKFWSSESKGKLVCTLPSRDKTRPKVKGGCIVFSRRTTAAGTHITTNSFNSQ